MIPPPPLLMVSVVLPSNIQALTHVFQCISDFLMPKTIDGAVYNELNRVVKMYKSSRPWTVGAMDGAATKGRLDIVRRLYVTREEGCSTLAFIGAARNNHVEVLRWLYMFYEAKSNPGVELTVAARNGHLEAVYFLLPGMREYEVELAIAAAIINGHVAVVETLLPRTENKRITFIIAATNNQVPVLQLLFESYGFYYSHDVLLIAADLGHVRVMELVVEVCVQRDIHDALYFAAKRGHTSAVRLLMERRNLDAEAIAEAVMIAAIEEKCCTLKHLVEGSRILDSYNSKFSVMDPIQRSIYCELCWAVRNGHLNVVKVLIGKASFHHVAEMMRSAATTNRIEMMELLLKVGLEHQASDYQKRRCLIEALRNAVIRSSISMASLLLDKGWNVDVGQLLYIAIEDNDTEMAKLLAVKSSQAYLENALISGAVKGNIEMVKMFLEVSDQITVEHAVFGIAATNNVEMIKLTLEKCDPSKYYHLFAFAARYGFETTIEQLVGMVVAYSITRALTCAAARGYTEVVKVLVDRSDGPSIKFAMEAAALEGRLDVVKLLQVRCDLRAINDATVKAEAAGFADVVKQLTMKRARLE